MRSIFKRDLIKNCRAGYLALRRVKRRGPFWGDPKSPLSSPPPRHSYPDKVLAGSEMLFTPLIATPARHPISKLIYLGNRASELRFERRLGGTGNSGGYENRQRRETSGCFGALPKTTHVLSNPNERKRLLKRSSESGIALLLVMSAIMILTMIGVEFAYNAQIEYQMAVRQRERLQAFYLANSGYNLTRLQLKIGNATQGQVQQATTQANIDLPVDLSAPLCQQFPIKTSLFRLLMMGESGEAPPPSNEEGAEATSETAENMFAAFPMQGLEEFLQFEGDFDSECADEASKIDLNFFYTQDPSKRVEGQDNAYDQYKKFLIGVLNQPTYKELFEKTNVKVLDVVRNIADWIDGNEVINEFGGSEGGGEDSVYRGGVSGQMAAKNGKLSLPGDIYLVEGVTDLWWIPLSELFTIYGTTSQDAKPQINVCRAPNEVVRALILRYTETRTDLPPVKPEDEEILGQLVQTVKGGCTGAVPDKNKIAQDLDAKLLEILKASPTTTTGQPTGGQAGYGTTASRFADWIATQSRFFSLNIKGAVGDTVVTIKSVIDMGQAGGSDTSKWKTVYYKVQ
ncbi:MAG: hypothetical protein A3F82_01745 [Deltaproteobacteria bacterium RIFCSPLOWO2_12_FULL_44_12]|nr:MAG: hypothetical protein A2712_03215 [Deltaproteobacteria bacterium RIFCSPHIGHO2_01_FULL_43_49]OGQ16203.1 MAG: hypothetical protein A3D22_01185 [Deltaproteobacteria bacterium RIFCSPHIGHO2_02_FULL_44_53]OGQ29163.1 MAG: hypothetical protein A3D98_04970 [Deltaproteobacteria bacterium RIFCSPHIGHO2_12_FULL_44_21]OGQ32720.1 MAG: hypothetical protein A2979_09115 [Deltaproteobacteria bacterium RIFCSPLOWO2_01_FULL_45_74]OGQ41822.1 MAG: hypothetical protein A3I70_08900 [Deltaproteobacteria bacterium 